MLKALGIGFLLLTMAVALPLPIEAANPTSPPYFTGLGNCPNAVVYSYNPPVGSMYPLNLYVESNGSITAAQLSNVSGTIFLAHPLAGPIAVIQCVGSNPQKGDPQLGEGTTNSVGYYGAQDNEYSDNTILTANIGIGLGLYDNSASNVWYHIGIGNNNCAGSGNQKVCFSTCTTPPFFWGEYSYSGIYYELPFLCGSYGTWYGMAIVVDNVGFWDYWVNGVFEAGVKTGVGGTAIGTKGCCGSYDWIETGTVPGQRASSYTNTIFSPALQYALNKLNNNNPFLGSITFANPTSLIYWNYNSQWPTTYWSELPSYSSGLWSISYTWK